MVNKEHRETGQKTPSMPQSTTDFASIHHVHYQQHLRRTSYQEFQNPASVGKTLLISDNPTPSHRKKA
jgi:hypothetical protein